MTVIPLLARIGWQCSNVLHLVVSLAAVNTRIVHFLACEIITHSLTLTVAEVHNASGSKHREASCRDIHLLQPELFNHFG